MPEPPIQLTAPGDAPENVLGGVPGDVYATDLAPFSVAPELSLCQVIAQIERGGEGVALVIEETGYLLGTVTDGDVRRGLLAGIGLDRPVRALLEAPPGAEPGRGHGAPVTAPITAPWGTNPVALLRLMGEHMIRHVPLLDEAGKVAGLALLSRFVRRRELPLKAVIMAGGLGTRLRPLTEATPKPMLPVGDRPLLERTIEQLGQAGIRSINITTHYHADKIKEHFGDGSSFGARVHYSHEQEPLGTAGALRLVEAADYGEDPLLVINGDVLTKVDYRAMLDFHREHRAQLTMGVRRYAMQVPYGVVDCDGPTVRSVREKPEFSFFVNAGIYLVEPRLCCEIPAQRRFDMTDLIALLQGSGRRVVSFPIHEYWLDIGQLDDYERAQQDVRSGAFAS
ncbi:MAG: nucleotidyltransferase family protein [Rhodospirillales bacterium]|nr:nucleotidyltransferase family protein [Rhodospirillales bacterium]